MVMDSQEHEFLPRKVKNGASTMELQLNDKTALVTGSTLQDTNPGQRAHHQATRNHGSITGRDINHQFNILWADMFALYIKTKNRHWHMSGPHFRDYHLLLDEQAAQIKRTTDAIAERGRKLARTTRAAAHPSAHRACHQPPSRTSADLEACGFTKLASERSQQWLTALHGKTLPVTLFGLRAV
jgi:Ferritin-like domain